MIIKGDISNASQNTKVRLMVGEGSVFRPVINDSIVDNKFYFELPIDSTMDTPMSLAVASGKTSVTFWAADGVTTIKGDAKKPREWVASNRTPEQIQGNEIAKAGSKYKTALNDLLYREQVLRDAKADRPKIDSLRNSINLIQDKINIEELKYLSSQKKLTVSGLEALESLAKFGLVYGKGLEPYKKDIQEVYDRLPDTQKQSSYGKVIHSALNPKVARKKGDQLPSDLLMDVDGGSHTLSEYYGKYILIDVWSSGCGPCIMACDELRQMQELYKDKLTIVGISLDNEKVWKTASKMHNISWTNLSDLQGQTAGFCANFEIRGIPYYIIADPQGRIVEIHIGYGKGMFEKIFKDLLAQ